MFNEEIKELLEKRLSVRKFKDKPLDSKDLEKVVRASWNSPTSMDSHCYSIIKVTNQDKLKKVAETIGQEYVAKAKALLVYVADFTRLEKEGEPNEEYIGELYLNPLFMASLNIGLAMMSAIIQGETMGIGFTCIGAMRCCRNEKELGKIWKDLFNLPDRTFVICGLILGYKEEIKPPKPKLPFEAQVFENEYKKDAFTPELRKKHSDQLISYYINDLKIPSLAKEWTKVQKVYFWGDKGKNYLGKKMDKKLIKDLHNQKLLLNYNLTLKD